MSASLLDPRVHLLSVDFSKAGNRPDQIWQGHWSPRDTDSRVKYN